ncbi:MAG: DNA internalization-related competence protein ComEC/Rec2 [Pseudomonadales bacterium]|nr:DNA internalization-related competence protein ComEC/Rec2 [Pseudomonadales bacterium]
MANQFEGKDLWVTGTVSNIPLRRELHKNSVYQRFEVSVKSLELVDGALISQKKHDTWAVPRKMRISWYAGKQVEAGEVWQWKVRLKRPRGFSNPAGFDYEGWLFSQRIGATGYVKKSRENKRLKESDPFQFIPALRSKISSGVNSLIGDLAYKGPILALVNGDRSKLSSAQWDTLLKTGTNHLMVISGLHIGLIAVMAYRLTGFLLGWLRLPFRVGVPIPSWLRLSDPLFIQCWAAMAAAACYTLIAGFSLSTQRALVMVCVVMIAQLSGRNLRPSRSILLALAVVLLLDPLSVISIGFWLSFSAVGALLYVFANRRSATPSGISTLWMKWGMAQWTVFIALLPVLSLLLLNVSVVSPFANLIAVPVVSLLIVPLCLAGAMMAPFFEIPATLLLTMANGLFEWLWLYLEWLESEFKVNWYPGGISFWNMLIALLGIVLLLAPKAFPARWLGVLCLLPLLLPASPKLSENEVQLTILDVGQGLSVSLRTANHQLLYDTGPRFSADFDAGSAVIIPFLRKTAVSSIDTLILSHGDIDHVGGAEAILNHLPIAQVLLGSTNKKVQSLLNDLPEENALCRAGMSWQWDGVRFDILYPFDGQALRENNHSCVLMVDNGTVRILLTGDIEARAEKALIKIYGDALKADVLIAPHHGSRTSSSQKFIGKVSPQQVVFSSGYKNRFHHPNAAVVERYRAMNVEIINTAVEGAIVYYFKANVDEEKALQSTGRLFFRQENRKYWHVD